MSCPNGCGSDPFGSCRDCIRREERERVLKEIEKVMTYHTHWSDDLDARVIAEAGLERAIRRLREES